MKPESIVLESDIEHGLPIPTSSREWGPEKQDPVHTPGKNHLVEIANECASIYSTAADIYRSLAKMGETTPVTVFWMGLCEEIEKQSTYWGHVCERLKDGCAKLELPDSPQRILRHLEYVSSKLTRLFHITSMQDSLTDSFLRTHCIEVFLLHPTLLELNDMALTSVYREVDEFNQAKHLTRFFFGMDEYTGDFFASEGLKESLQRLWKYKKTLIMESEKDAVSGALNRKGLFKQMGRLSNLAQRNGHSIALLMFTIENIEECYHRGGCDVADQMLVELMTSLKSIIRESDVVGRYDFSRFLVYFSQVKQQFLYDIANRLLDRVSLIQRSGLSLSVFVGGSYGILGGEKARSLQTYIDAAEDCLRRARLSQHTRVLIE